MWDYFINTFVKQSKFMLLILYISFINKFKLYYNMY